MSLANLIALVSSVNVDPNTASEINDGPEIVETVIGRNLPKPVRGKKVPAPIHNQVAAQVVTIDANTFMSKMRKARDRNEQIQAIMEYTGKDRTTVSSNFGTFDQESRARAMREIRGVNTAGPSRAEQRQAERSAAGFVAGMPKPQQRIVLDLQARAVSLAESRDNAKTDAERAQYQTLLNATNEALSQMGF